MSTMIAHNIPEHQAMLARYMALTRKTPDAVLEAKGRDLGIKLYQGFRNVRWRGKNIAYREFRRRLREGRGTLVRQKFISERWADRIPLTQTVTRRGERRGRSKAQTYPTSTWQRLMAQELLRRAAGQGALAASFLWFRRRSNLARGTFYVRNNAGNSLGFVDRGEGYLRIVGLTDGLAKVSNRYGIVFSVLAAQSADMATYVERKERENFQKAFGGAAAS